MDWYPDPADASRERYWDGTQWTHNTRAMLAPPAEPQPRQPRQPRERWEGTSQAPDGPAQPRQAPQHDPARYDPAQRAPMQQRQLQHRPGPSDYALSQGAQATHTADGVPLAGWWWRVLSTLVDMLLVMVVSWTVGYGYLMRALSGYQAWLNDLTAASQGQGLVDVTAIYSYDIVAPLSILGSITMAIRLVYLTITVHQWSASAGQLAFKLRVVPADRGLEHVRQSWKLAGVRAVVQELLRLDPIGILRLISSLMPLWTRKRQTIHDMVARSQVVKL